MVIIPCCGDWRIEKVRLQQEVGYNNGAKKCCSHSPLGPLWFCPSWLEVKRLFGLAIQGKLQRIVWLDMSTCSSRETEEQASLDAVKAVKSVEETWCQRWVCNWLQLLHRTCHTKCQACSSSFIAEVSSSVTLQMCLWKEWHGPKRRKTWTSQAFMTFSLKYQKSPQKKSIRLRFPRKNLFSNWNLEQLSVLSSHFFLSAQWWHSRYDTDIYCPAKVT